MLSVERMSAFHPSETLEQSTFRQAAQAGSKVDLLRNLQRVVHLDAEISDGALQLSVAEQELAGT